jgi:hypothetical protein
MTIALLTALVAVNAAYLLLLDRRDRRDREDRAADRRQVQYLLQRIQAPELAVIEHAQADVQADDPVPVTDADELELEEREAIERMERLESEMAPWLAS